VMVKHPVKVSSVVRDTYTLINTTRLSTIVLLYYLLCTAIVFNLCDLMCCIT